MYPLSALQADILDQLTQGHQPATGPRYSVHTLAALVLGHAPTSPQMKSFRRSLRRLEQAGLIVVARSELWRGRRVDLAPQEPPA